MELELEVELEEEDALLLKTLHLVCAAQPRGNPQVEVDTTAHGYGGTHPLWGDNLSKPGHRGVGYCPGTEWAGKNKKTPKDAPHAAGVQSVRG